MPDDSDWQVLAEEAAQERDPKKLMEIISALTAAIEARQSTKPDAPSASNPT